MYEQTDITKEFRIIMKQKAGRNRKSWIDGNLKKVPVEQVEKIVIVSLTLFLNMVWNEGIFRRGLFPFDFWNPGCVVLSDRQFYFCCPIFYGDLPGSNTVGSTEDVYSEPTSLAHVCF